MAREGIERRLTTIMSADVVGYSRLMAGDEAGTFAQLKTHRRELIEPKTAEHHGRVVKLTGDGTLMEFASVVDAVNFAVEVQQAMVERNAGVPEDRQIKYRIGINIGDIIVDGEDIYGEGVNVAARLEGLAEPGGICISAKVYEEVRNKLPTAFEDLGEQEVKNIPDPVRVYRWTDAAAASTTDTGKTEGALPLPNKPSMAVLPFTNMSGDPDQEFFADGISEDIITELSKFRSLIVIARNSSFAFKGQSLDVKELSKRLGVRYLVEGSVRRAGNRVRVTAQLVDAVADAHLWAERYDRDLDDIFAVQDEVTNAIVTAIEPTLGSAERGRAHRKPTERLDAWESYQRGMWNVYRYAAQENTEAQTFFRRAIELDPNFAPAHAGLAYAIYLSVMLGFGADPASALGEARDAAERAVTLDGDDALAHVAVGRLHLMVGEHEAAISACETALALNPNLATARFGLGWALTYTGRREEGLAELDEAIRLSPRDPMLWGFLVLKAQAYIAMERYEEGLKFARAAQRQPNAGVWAYVSEAVALAQLDRIEEARQALERVSAIKPDFDMNFAASTIAQMRAVGFEFYLDALKKAGLP
ncbi:MAG: adenylate/guanylate cyclase domain-containing protein [Alphaproteobacteria bacterium]